MNANRKRIQRETLQKLLKDIRLDAKLRQGQVAKKLGVPQACVRTASEFTGYTIRGQSRVSSPKLLEFGNIFKIVGLTDRIILDRSNEYSDLIKKLSEYFDYRAKTLNEYVEPRLMDSERAEKVFNELLITTTPTQSIPMNKQKGKMRKPAYLTGIVNMLIEHNSCGMPCDYDPHALTTITQDGFPIRTMARRHDGAFPSRVDPLAVWEIKEYYYTTTFGSRVADGIYETLLDGMELEELYANEGVKVLHYLMLDSHFTWWKCGRSYLCRVFDLLHMGYLDEVLFGYEVVERLPSIVKEWVELSNNRNR
jgi:hypothetical protein